MSKPNQNETGPAAQVQSIVRQDVAERSQSNEFDYERDCRRPIKAWIRHVIEDAAAPVDRIACHSWLKNAYDNVSFRIEVFGLQIRQQLLRFRQFRLQCSIAFLKFRIRRLQ